MPANENPADFFMDVISGQIPRRGDSSFKPKQLPDLWCEHGASVPKTAATAEVQDQTLTPEELEILEKRFKDMDTNNDGGSWTPERTIEPCPHRSPNP